MKRYLILLSGLIITCSLTIAQSSYTLLTTNSLYGSLNNADTLNQGQFWAESSYPVSIGFPFTFYDETYNDVTLHTNGMISMTDGDLLRAITAYAFMIDKGDSISEISLSPILTSLTGTPGSRIRKFEWQNAGFMYGSSSDYINFQIWMYEGTNQIQIHFGEWSINSFPQAYQDHYSISHTGPMTGLIYSFLPPSSGGGGLEGLFLIDDPNDPETILPTGLTNGRYHLGGLPAPGTMYTFSPGLNTSVLDLVAERISVYPNPATEVLHIDRTLPTAGPHIIRILNLQGQELMQQHVPDLLRLSLQIGHLPAGVYLAEVDEGVGSLRNRFIKY